jgi:TatD DNase family protein
MSGLGRILGGGARERGANRATGPVANNDDVLAASLSGTEPGESPAHESGDDSTPLWTDSHCHLQSLSAEDFGAALARARESGVGRLVIVGTDEESSRRASAVALEVDAKDDPPVETWATVGLHPHDASSGVEGINRYLGELSASGMSSSRVVAVGECGLDYHYDHSPRAEQRKAFAEQVALAHKHGLALVIHTREAWDDTFAILDHEAAPARVVFHCFTGGPEEARACLDRGAYLSFSGIVTFPSADDVRAAATLCPMDRMLVETDAPFLTPVPHRGKPNEPAYVPLVGSAIAALKGLDAAAVAQATTTNAAVAFNIQL